MAALTDEQISLLIAMPKIVKAASLKSKVQKQSDRANYQLVAVDGVQLFELYTRQNLIDPDAYSCGLIYFHAPGERGITLVRYNGSNHVHYNPLEGGARIINKCHIHRATQRYMEAGDKGDKYAETTARYSNMREALACMLEDCCITGLAVDEEPQSQIGLFDD